MRNDVFNNRRYVPVIRYNDPTLQAAMLNNQGDYARIFVMINNVFIGHSGLVLDEGEYSFLYDPAGSYTGCKNNKCEGSVKSFRGSGDYFEYPDFNWDDYLQYQLDDGEDIIVFEFIVPDDQMKNMKDNILNYSDFATDFTCATNVARVLRESGGIFSDIDDGFFTPWGLKGALFEIQVKKGIMPYAHVPVPQ